jgi:hypothetical protein
VIATKPLKPRACDCCGKTFKPWSPFQSVCKPACLLRKVNREEREKKAQAKERAKLDRMMDKAAKEAQEPIRKLIAAADKAFQAFIRERDRQAGHLCISSGQPLDWSGNKTDAGHYRSKGAASHLRYNEDNCHAQTKNENRFKAGNAVDYRIHLIGRIGLARVEALECDNEPIKWERHALRQIATIYRGKLRELKKGQ